MFYFTLKLQMLQGFAPPRAPLIVGRQPLSSLALGQRLRDCFATTEDPRVERTRLHQLGDIGVSVVMDAVGKCATRTTEDDIF